MPSSRPSYTRLLNASSSVRPAKTCAGDARDTSSVLPFASLYPLVHVAGEHTRVRRGSASEPTRLFRQASVSLVAVHLMLLTTSTIGPRLSARSLLAQSRICGFACSVVSAPQPRCTMIGRVSWCSGADMRRSAACVALALGLRYIMPLRIYPCHPVIAVSFTRPLWLHQQRHVQLAHLALLLFPCAWSHLPCYFHSFLLLIPLLTSACLL